MGKIRRQADFTERRAEGVKLTFLGEGGQRVQEAFTIVYRSYSRRGIGRIEQELEKDKVAGTDVIPYAAIFPKLIVSILDQDNEPLTDETGAPAELTREFFDGLLNEDLEAIQAGMTGDENPPKPSPTSGASGSNPEVSEG
jgi:hypothetical protein